MNNATESVKIPGKNKHQHSVELSQSSFKCVSIKIEYKLSVNHKDVLIGTNVYFELNGLIHSFIHSFFASNLLYPCKGYGGIGVYLENAGHEVGL